MSFGSLSLPKNLFMSKLLIYWHKAVRGNYEFIKDCVHIFEIVQTKIWVIIKSLSIGNPFFFLFLKGF